MNGEEALQKSIAIIREALANNEKEEIMPIGLMLLDFQMPLKNGIQVIEEIRIFINQQSKRSKIKILEPNFVFLTSYSTK